eukprot:4713769-Prymnesium_polylepis.1
MSHAELFELWRTFCLLARSTSVLWLSDSWNGRREPSVAGVMVSATHGAHRGARGRGGRHTYTAVLSVPESSSPELYATAAVQV